MAKITIILEDVKESKSGAWIKSRSVWDPPPNMSMFTNGELDPNKCTIAQFLANEIGNFIESKISMERLDTGL